MTILLLGGNGLLGHNVLKRLLDQGYAVHVLVRKPSALFINDFPNKERLRVYEGSILDDQKLWDACQGCDAIINCAGVTDMSLLRYDDYLPVNRDLCTRLIQLMERCGISRLVHTSTANTIGYGDPTDMADERYAMRAPFIQSFYAQSKFEGELILQEAARVNPNWHVVVVNPGFMVGGYDTKPSSGALLLAAYRKPLMVSPKGGKSFVHVADAAEAIVNAITAGRNGHRYLLTGANISIKEFYQLQAKVCGYRQLVVSLPDWILLAAGRAGDLLRWCGVKTQLATRNVRQLMVREYYSCQKAISELAMPQSDVGGAVKDFFEWYVNK